MRKATEFILPSAGCTILARAELSSGSSPAYLTGLKEGTPARCAPVTSSESGERNGICLIKFLRELIETCVHPN